jgi:hypothetical protein
LQTPRAPITSGGASASNSTGSGGSSSNWILTEGVDKGFSFDAFGLDANMVDQEVSAAIKDLAGDWGDEFPLQSFDSPNGSRSSTPQQAIDEDGFEDGFRLTGISGLPLHVKESPAGSEKSSLSSSTERASEEQSNLFKEQAGFHKCKTPARQQQNSYTDHNWASFETSPFGDSFSPSYARSEAGLVSKVSILPTIPQLDKSRPSDAPGSRDDFGADFDSFRYDYSSPKARGPRSDFTSSDVVSDVNVSDVGVSSDFAGNSDSGTGEIPIEVLGGKLKKTATGSARREEEKKQELQDVDEESFADWSTRSPVKGTANWGEDIVPSDGEEQERYEREPEWQKGSEAGKNFSKNEISVQQRRAQECTDQRTSLESLKSRLKAPKSSAPKSYARSDIGDLRTGGSSELNSVLNRVRSGQGISETKSDHGHSSTFQHVADLASKFERSQENVRTFVGHHREEDDDQYDAYDEDQLSDEYYQDETSNYGDRYEQTEQDFDEPLKEQRPKNTTYRERRERELRKEREEKARKEAEERANQPPERDVAALIRKRVAANKHRMKKVSMESKITQFKAPTDSQPEVMIKDLKKVSETTSDTSVVSPTSPHSLEEARDLVSLASLDTIEQPMSELTTLRETPSPMPSMSLVHQAIAKRAAAGNEVKHDLHREEKEESIAESTDDTKNMLNAFFSNRLAGGPSLGPFHQAAIDETSSSTDEQQKADTSDNKYFETDASALAPVPEGAPASDLRPALKDDPKYDRYFKMLKVGMPMDVVKHAMSRDGMDPSVMDGDHSKPAGFGAGVPLKEDPKYEKYFKMLKIGLPMGAVKNAMERDDLDPSVMDGDHNLPANFKSEGERDENKEKDTHRRTRLHWDTLRKVRSNSLWAKIDQDEELDNIEIDEDEFQELFQAELTPSQTTKARTTAHGKRGAAVRVIDSKRANNGGIILARLKMTHDDMADAVDRIDHHAMSPEQMQNIIEYLPTSEERKALEEYMLAGGTDAAEKFDGLCECEKFMVAMMTVKHAKRKVRALLFKHQFQSCLDSLVSDASVVETACDELSNSVRLRKLLGIVLNVGNRLNTAGVSGKRKAGAFTLESLLKLNHAKAFDKKTTFLHYIVLVVQRNNELLLRFKDDIPTVVKADRVYWDQIELDLEEVENQLENVRRIALHQASLMMRYRLRKKTKKPQSVLDDDENSLSDTEMTLEEEVEALRATEIGLFTLGAIKKVSALREKVETTKSKFKKLLEYFGEEDKELQPHELFHILATFCRDFDKAKEQVFVNVKKKQREERMHKRANSDPNLKKNQKEPPKRMLSAPLRASSLQPNMEKVVKDLSQRPPTTPRNGQSDRRLQPPPKYPTTHSHQNEPRPRPKLPPSRPPSSAMSDHPDDEMGLMRSPRGYENSSMRQRAVQQRRRRMNAAPISPETEIYSEVEGTGSQGERQLSPRSNIRQRRRDERRQSQRSPPADLRFPEDIDEAMELNMALD